MHSFLFAKLTFGEMSAFPFLATVTSCLFLNVATLHSCTVSISTLGQVTKCPKSEMEWKERSKEKRCEDLAHHQNCTSVENFSYHCILNADATKLVEVCAPKWFMTGYCARFSSQEERIVNDPELDCTQFNPPCPPRYPSTEAFKYQNCYAGLPKRENGTPDTNGHDSSALSPVVWILIALSICLSIGLIIVTALCIKKNRKKSQEKNIEENGQKDINGSDLRTTPRKKMEIKHLSGGKSVECDVKAVKSVAELKVKVAKALNSPKEFIEIVDNRNLILYQDDTHFEDFLKHEDEIFVIERPRTRESQLEKPEIVENENERSGFLSGCTHSNNPVELFHHIQRVLIEEEGIHIRCPDCEMNLVMDDALKLCNMSDDEMCFYKKKLNRNRTWRQQVDQINLM